MPTNLVSSVTKILTPDLLRRIALGLGLDKAIVEKAVMAGIPGLLAALASLVAKPGGAEKLSDAVAQEQPGILTNIANVLGGTGQGALIDNGVNTLSSLLGGSTTSALTNAVGRFANVDKRESNDLMGVLGPLLMGALGQQKRASGLNASGLAQLITSQKDNIARAMPRGFPDYLSGTGILDAVTGSNGEGSEAVGAEFPPHRNGAGCCRCWGPSRSAPWLGISLAASRRKRRPFRRPRRSWPRQTKQKPGSADRSLALTARRWVR